MSTPDPTDRLVHLALLLRMVAVALALGTLAGPPGRTAPAVAALLAAAGWSFLPLRWGDGLLPLLRRRPILLGIDLALSWGLLLAAGPTSLLFHHTLATAALAGVVGGRSGAVGGSTVLALGYATACRTWRSEVHATAMVAIGLPALYPLVALGAATVAAALRAEADAGRERAELARREGRTGERARLARELHDSVSATALGVSLQAEALRAELEAAHHPLADRAGELCTGASRATAEARQLLSALRDRPTGADLRAVLAEQVDQVGLVARVHLAGALDVEGADRRFEVGRIVREALRNAARHAPGASITVLARPCGDDDLVELVVHDDGPGFDPDLGLRRAAAAGRFGLVGLRERVEGLGGSLQLRSGPDQGTTVIVRVPRRRPPAARSAPTDRPGAVAA